MSDTVDGNGMEAGGPANVAPLNPTPGALPLYILPTEFRGFRPHRDCDTRHAAGFKCKPGVFGWCSQCHGSYCKRCGRARSVVFYPSMHRIEGCTQAGMCETEQP